MKMMTISLVLFITQTVIVFALISQGSGKPAAAYESHYSIHDDYS